MRPRRSVLVVVVGIAVLMLTLGLPTVAARGVAASPTPYARGHTITVWPNGYNDTTDIQNAFTRCTSHGWTCTIQLEKGTYYIAQIYAYGFQGSFVGIGQGVTIVQALPNLAPPAPAYNTSTSPFWAGPPGPQNPWPGMIIFMNGSFAMSRMTITDPYSNADRGWNSQAISGGVAVDTALFTAIEVGGVYASAAFDHVTVLGAPGDASGTNMWDAITYEGLILTPGWTPANLFLDTYQLSGTFSVTNSVFNYVESGPWVDTIVNSTVTICDNTLTNSVVPLGFFDASNSTLTFCGNRVPSLPYYTAFEAIQSLNRPDTPSTVYITGNDFHVNDAANALFLMDLGADWEIPNTLSAVVAGNVFQTNTSCGCYVGSEPSDYSVIISENLKSLDVSGNTILGGGSAGVYVDGGPGVVSGNTIVGSYDGVNLNSTDGVHVTGNLIKNSALWGIALTNESSYNVVAWNFVKGSGAYDLYWDGTGTDNTWAHNVCQTSSPPGLC